MRFNFWLIVGPVFSWMALLGFPVHLSSQKPDARVTLASAELPDAPTPRPAYYPSKTQTAGGYTEKFAYAVGRDALVNVFREFWPGMNAHVLHRHC